VVKVQRPNIERMVRSDLGLLARQAAFLEKRSEIARNYSLSENVEELGYSLINEMDYKSEAQNIDRFYGFLETAIDTAIEISGAERGFLLLSENETWRVAVSRDVDGEPIRRAILKVSTTIAERVAEGGEPLITVDARADDRFRLAESVHELALTVSHDDSLVDLKALQRIHCQPGSPLGPEAHDDVDEQDHRDRGRLQGIPEHQRQRCCDDQEPHHHAGELVPQDSPGRDRAGHLHLIGAVKYEPLTCLGRR